MDGSQIVLIVSVLKILVGFVICSAITWLSVKAAIAGIITSGGIAFLFDGDKKRGYPILFIGVVFFLFTFPLGAWLLQEDLKIIEFNRVPRHALSIIFGCSHFIIFMLFRAWDKKRQQYKKSRGADVKYFY